MMNEILNKFFKRLTGKEIIQKPYPQGVTRSRDAREQLGYLQKERHDEMERQRAEQEKELDEEIKAQIKAGRKEAIKRKLSILTSNDLGLDLKLRRDYKELRKKRRAERGKKDELPSIGWSKHDWR